MSGKSYLKNAAVLTASGLVLRLAGMGFRIWLAGLLGGEGLGLYELVLAFYGLFVTVATSGIAAASTRLMAEELTHGPARAAGMLRRLMSAALGLGGLAGGAQFLLAGPAAAFWLGDARAAAAIRAAAPGLPCMAVSAVLRGFFLARRRAEPNALSQLAEQGFRIGAVAFLLHRAQGQDAGLRCALVMAGSAASEMLSTFLMLLFYRGEAKRTFGGAKPAPAADANRRLWAVLWPVEAGRCLSGAMHTAENMLVPACLGAALAGQGGRAAALEQYGILKGMALPLLFFPFGLLGTLATLLVPELTEAHVQGSAGRMRALLDRMLTLTLYAAVFAGAAFFVWSGPLAAALYQNRTAGEYLRALAPVMPLMYLESMVDAAMKALGQQKAAFGYTAVDSALRILGVAALVPRYGMTGFLGVMVFSNAFTCLINLRRLLKTAGMGLRPVRWVIGPLAAALPAVWIGRSVSLRLGWLGWPAIAAGGCAACGVWVLAAGQPVLKEIGTQLRVNKKDAKNFAENR